MNLSDTARALLAGTLLMCAPSAWAGVNDAAEIDRVEIIENAGKTAWFDVTCMDHRKERRSEADFRIGWYCLPAEERSGVAILKDPDFFEYTNKRRKPTAEIDDLEEALASWGIQPQIVKKFTIDQLQPHLERAKVLIMGKRLYTDGGIRTFLERLDGSMKHLLRRFVQSGGHLVVLHTPTFVSLEKGSKLINSIFGWRIEVSDYGSGHARLLRGPFVPSMIGGLPDSITPLRELNVSKPGTLPAGSISLYRVPSYRPPEGLLTNLIPYGKGWVIDFGVSFVRTDKPLDWTYDHGQRLDPAWIQVMRAVLKFALGRKENPADSAPAGYDDAF